MEVDWYELKGVGVANEDVSQQRSYEPGTCPLGGDCAHEQHYYQLSTDIREMTTQVGELVSKLDNVVSQLISIIGGQTPQRFVPYETHRLMVRGLLWIYSVALIASVGAVSLIRGLPHFLTSN